MHIAKRYITNPADQLITSSILAQNAYNEIEHSIKNMIGEINNSSIHCNGVVPVKEGCYKLLEETYGWYREKPLDTLSEKGGPIDVYKEFLSSDSILRVGLEFETGNISSAHRSMNKLILGITNNELDLAVLILPIHDLSYYLTDRVSNYEELQPYYPIVDKYPFMFLGFDAEDYSPIHPILSKGSDGMSKRSKRLWSYFNNKPSQAPKNNDN